MKNIYNNLKKYKIKIFKFNFKKTIFCLKRKKFLVFNYEELLRQKIIFFLIIEKMYKLQNIYVEKYFNIKDKIYKVDILIKKKKQNYIIIECKTPLKKINNNNINQILNYGKILNTKYFYLTNEIENIIFKINNNNFFFLKDIPSNNFK